MYYDRQIKYFDYIKDGVRLRGAGFLKAEIRGEDCNMTIQIFGLPQSDAYTGTVYGVLGNREELLGNILLQGGRGDKSLQLAYADLQAIRIPLGNGFELYCRIGEPSSVHAEAINVPEVNVTEAEDVTDDVNMAEVANVIETANVTVGENIAEVAKEMLGEAVEESRFVAETAASSANEPVSSAAVPIEPAASTPALAAGYQSVRVNGENTVTPRQRRMMEEKWEQLWGVYPHLFPFQDSREYLQISPEDFVILREPYYKMVHNSFLLHGFYNYQHLILTRLERRSESFYYIGVPGNFYDREKQVALMYGFESFECAVEPAGMGDFGYYMIRVEL